MRTTVCKVMVNKMEVAHGKMRVHRVGVRRKVVLERMYHDSKGHFWSKVEPINYTDNKRCLSKVEKQDFASFNLSISRLGSC